MLVNFKFKNFLSFRDECNFTMEANADKEHESELIIENGERLSKTRLIYGANASGKTSFMEALAFVGYYVSTSNQMLDATPINLIPFKFQPNFENIPSEFEITINKEGIRYIYEFSCTTKKVMHEKLIAYYSSKPTTIFERMEDSYKFNVKDEKFLNDIKNKNTANKLFLVTSATWNYDKTKPVVDFFNIDLNVLTDASSFGMPYFDRIVAENKLDDYKEFCVNTLSNADISISDFEVDIKKLGELPPHPVINSIFNNTINNNQVDIKAFAEKKVYRFTTYHDIQVDGNMTKYALNLSEESLGTRQMFMIAPLLYYTFKEGKTILIDELDKSLHPLLVEHIIKLFKDSSINSKNAQLIANTHDTNLLDLDLLRRDEIWFTERNFESGSTTMYQLSDFSPRKNENIERAYLLGRFGAIPFIKEV